MVEEKKNSSRLNLSLLTGKVVDLTEKLALETKLISQNSLDYYKISMETTNSLNLKWDKRKFDALIAGHEIFFEDHKDTDPNSKYDIATFNAFTTLVQNAINNARFADRRPAPEERIKHYLTHLLMENDGKEQQVIDDLAGIKSGMIVSLVHTMHPTIFHTVEAREFEKQLTNTLSSKTLSEEEKLGSVKELLGDFMKKTKSGEASITPMKKVTIHNENEVETDNIARMNKYFEDVMDGWNRAVKAISSDLKWKNLKNFDKLEISEQDRTRIKQIRNWGRGADADGREKSTALLVAESIYDYTEGYTKEFEGPKIDMRQNARVFGLAVNALIQLNYRNSNGHGYIGTTDNYAFKNFAEGFVEKAKGSENNPLSADWSSAKKLFMEMPRNHQQDFVREIIMNDVKLLPTEIQSYSVAFAKEYPKIFREFVESKRSFLESNGKPIPRSYDEMLLLPSDVKTQEKRDKYANLSKEFRDYVASKLISYEFEGHMKKINIQLKESGLFFEPLDNTLGNGMLQGIKKVMGKTVTDLTDLDRTNIMNLFKRLSLINDAIDTYGDKVADRHQIANFGQEQHFYQCLAVFKEAGLIEVKNGEVTKVKMKIMPLLETKADQDRFIPMFEKLLKDPLARSYFKTAGATFMIGFSDGAKGDGNFASEWNAYQTVKKLTEIAQREGVDIRIFFGRGRRSNRGGLAEAGTGSTLLPDNWNQKAITDMTVQSDFPSHMAMAEAYGQDQMASMFIGTVHGAFNAKHRTEEELKHLELHSETIDWIAKRSSEVFSHLVRDNPEAGFFIDGMPSNGDISSRKQNRPENAGGPKDGLKLYEDKRAVPIEFSSLVSMLGFHDVGLLKALKELEESPIKVPDKNGEYVGGKDAIKALMQHPWFEEQIKRRYEGLQNINFDVAAEYGKRITYINDEKEKVTLEGFVENVKKEVDGLKEYLSDVMSIKKDSKFSGKAKAGEGYDYGALNYFSQSLILSEEDIKGKSNGAKTVIRNALFSVSQCAFNALSTLSKYFEREGGRIRDAA